MWKIMITPGQTVAHVTTADFSDQRQFVTWMDNQNHA